MMTEWIGPALIATIVSGLVTIAGWYINHRRENLAEARRRQERVVDVQTALRAEIRSYRARASLVDLDKHAAEMGAWIMAGGGHNTPFVPNEPEFFIYTAIAKDIHILPEPVIDPVVLFYTQASSINLFAGDLRSDKYAALDANLKNQMYQDYLAMTEYAYKLADKALAALQHSLEEQYDH